MVATLPMTGSLWLREAREHIQFDSSGSRSLVYGALRARYQAYKVRGNLPAALEVLGFLWRTIDLPAPTQFARRELARLTTAHGVAAIAEASVRNCDRNYDHAAAKRMAASLRTDDAPFSKRILLLRARQPGSKGVLVVKFSETFKYFHRIFDEQIYRDYHVVLEPSWVGFFLPELLMFQSVNERVFVQAWEDRDFEFLQSLNSNLVAVPLSPSSWVNPTTFYPMDGVEKEYDVIYVANWADFKRHYALFRALKLSGNRHIRALCVGAPWGRTLADIEAQASHFGVVGQVDFVESVPQAKINLLFNKSKAALLLSRKEGSNKALVEAMFANIPGFLREGFNYGTRYPFVNSSTGAFFTDEGLPNLLERIHSGEFQYLNPRESVARTWSPARSTQVLEEYIGDGAGVKVKVNAPELGYLDRDDRVQMAGEHQQLLEYIRPEYKA